ncbi:DNA polymerase alpha catalytic subunit-like [Papaver somniferum]|uniref:DNA polymerase alpha catalytic subunit-like n=1 Tax=Papaver somniferum TaxID=3469 RepID=UPI000E6FADD2|nr:DNA polymerase alpha catalytic subunit-like [Papaver somniferum]
MSEPEVSGRRRGKGPEASARAEAMERLKSLRQGGKRSENGVQVKMDDPIYDLLDEDEYESLKKTRAEKYKGFIVDEDGHGYGDEGQEEDWTKSGVSFSSEEEESEGENEKVKKKKKEHVPVKKPNPLLAAAALMGKQRLSSMFTSSVFNKKDKPKGLSSDSLVDDVIAEFAPDETDREKRRRGESRSILRSESLTQNSLIKSRSEGLVKVNSIVRSESINVNGNGSLVRGNEEIGNQNDVEKESKDVEMVCADEVFDKFPQSHDDSMMDDKSGNVESSAIISEVKVEPVVKKDEVFTFNAKIKKETHSPWSATADLNAVRNEVNGNDIHGVVGSDSDKKSEESELLKDSDGSLPFYCIDAHEEFYGDGTIYLFGKVKAGNTYQSCCAVVKNMQRCVYAIPNGSIFQNDAILKLEEDEKENRITLAEFRSQLHEMASVLKNEITEKLLDLNVSTFSMTPVKRNYAFERTDIPLGEHYVLKITYPFKDPPLPTDLKGEHFSALMGTHCSALEHFLIKRKISGPSWLSFSKITVRQDPQKVSWCISEVVIDNPKDVRISSSTKFTMEIPPVVVTSINLKTVINAKQMNEIVSASLICCRKVKIDTPMLPSEWTDPRVLSHFTVVRKLEGGIFPMGFAKEIADRNAKAVSTINLAAEGSERALLNRLMLELYKLDTDIFVGHNISGFDLDLLLHRAKAYNISSWSKIGRLKRSVMPKLTKAGTIYGSGASPGIMSCIAGRLLCDTYLCSRDLLKEVSYSLTELTRTQLKKDRKEIASHEIPSAFKSSKSLMELVGYGETDAWLSMELMFHLSILPLYRQLTNISGNLWGKTLQGARAQRVEYLLLHKFHACKYIVPDKISAREKDNLAKRSLIHSADGGDVDDVNNNEITSENDPQQLNQGKRKKVPAYSGGLVLEPKKGLYDKYILLLDFNSLYPSIIREYNICFTTVERSADGSVPHLPSSKTPGILPELLKGLVERRKKVKKDLIKTASALQRQQLDIQQQALKLTANSIYGCLGFSNSRFYAKPLAELVTLQGREILQSTVDLVQNDLKLEVIYGDTDSIMIYTGLDDIKQSKEIASEVIKKVNKKYELLEIDLDGLYKRMLLLKKKKYAAIKVIFNNGKPEEREECKGLDLVRRDWSLLSKDIGKDCLSHILSGRSCEDVVESIHSSLMKVQEEMRNKRVELEKYIITKTLTKPPEAYPDAKNQPHVKVALRLKKAGYSSGCSAGDTVPYIICCEQGTTSSGSSAGIADRARHPDEVKGDNNTWILDLEYYLAQQIHPVVSRLCACIEGTSPARLADCLGLDSSKFQSKTSEVAVSDSSPLLSSAMDDDERYRGCEPLHLSCPSCSHTFECPSISSLALTLSSSDNLVGSDEEKLSSHFWLRLRCLKCPDEGEDRGRMTRAMLANQVKTQADGFISMYYKGVMTCDDETCKYTTRGLNLRVVGDSERGTVCPNYPHCNGHLVRKYTEADLYRQLTYFCHVLDALRFVEKLELKVRIPLERELARIQPMVDLAASIVQKLRDQCAYGWVQMKDLFVSL